MRELNKLIQICTEDGLRGGVSTALDHIHRRYLFHVTAIKRYYQYKIFSKYSTIADPFKLLWVSPQRIQYVTYSDFSNEHILNPPDRVNYKTLPKSSPYHHYVTRGSFEPHKHIGRITGGDWDRKETKFSDLHVYNALRSRFESDTALEETDYFKMMVERMENGRTVRDCSTAAEYKEKCEMFDEVFRSMDQMGCLPRRTLDRELTFKEIGVNIGRDGELFFNSDGHHRLSIAKVLQLDEIPVLVIARHKQWQRKRERLNQMIKNGTISASSSTLLSHPDMRDIVNRNYGI